MQTVQPSAGPAPYAFGDAAAAVADQRPALDALAQIVSAFGHLPVADFHVGQVYLDTLTISVHDSLDNFERWREALGMTMDSVEYRALTRNFHLKALTTFAGATVELVGYAPVLPEVTP